MTTPSPSSSSSPVTVPLSTWATVTLDGSGNGTAKVGPTSLREVWTVAAAAVKVATAAAEAQCSIYGGPDTSAPNFVDLSFTGSSGDSTANFGAPIIAGSYVFAVWAGGDPGAVATLVVTGSKAIY